MIRLRPDALTWLEIEGEIVALDRRSSMYLSVNRTGATLWPALQEGATVDELVALLVKEFDVDTPTASNDVAAFVDVLDARGLLVAE